MINNSTVLYWFHGSNTDLLAPIRLPNCTFAVIIDGELGTWSRFSCNDDCRVIFNGNGGFLCSVIPEAEFNEFEPRLKSAKNRFQLSACLNLVKFNTIISRTNHI